MSNELKVKATKFFVEGNTYPYILNVFFDGQKDFQQLVFKTEAEMNLVADKLNLPDVLAIITVMEAEKDGVMTATSIKFSCDHKKKTLKAVLDVELVGDVAVAQARAVGKKK